MIALVRPDSWDLPLFAHVLGAVALFGGVAAVVLLTVAGMRMPGAGDLHRQARLPDAAVRRLAGVHRDARRRAVDLLEGRPPPGHADWIKLGILVGDGGAVVLIGLTVARLARARAASELRALLRRAGGPVSRRAPRSPGGR